MKWTLLLDAPPARPSALDRIAAATGTLPPGADQIDLDRAVRTARARWLHPREHADLCHALWCMAHRPRTAPAERRLAVALWAHLVGRPLEAHAILDGLARRQAREAIA